MDTVLRATGLVKRFGDVVAVDGVDLTVRAGETVGLLGPNGAGKTTTLLMLLGAIDPDEGTVEILGHRLPAERSVAMASVGFAAGYLPLPERMRVREVLKLFGQLYGMPDPGPWIGGALDKFGIGHLAERRCTELSSGQRTLVGIVKAILHRPRLLVLDEPTASLDPEVARRVRMGLRELSHPADPDDQPTTMLITSHDMAEVERLCDRVVFVASGRVVADDTPTAVVERYGRGNLEDVFLHLVDGAP
ncbi:MAG: ABC transporter ATP-binding protein [Acidimicrobiales bacterium]